MGRVGILFVMICDCVVMGGVSVVVVITDDDGDLDVGGISVTMEDYYQ